MSITYFFQAPECLHLSTSIAYPVGIVAAVVFFVLFYVQTFVRKKDENQLAAQMGK